MLIKGIWPLDISPDNKYLVSNIDTKIQIIDIVTGNVTKSFELDEVFCGAFSFAFNLDCKSITLSSSDGVFIIDIKTEKIIKSFENLLLSDLHYSKNEKYLATTWYESPNIEISDVYSGKLLKTLKGNQDNIESMSFSNDERYIASCSGTKIIIWDLDNYSIIKTIDVGENTGQIFFSKDGSFLITTYFPPNNTTTIAFWDTKSWEITNKVLYEDLSYIDYSKDGKYIITNPFFNMNTNKFYVKVLDGYSGQELKRISCTYYGMVVLSHDNSKIAICKDFKEIIEIIDTGLI